MTRPPDNEAYGNGGSLALVAWLEYRADRRGAHCPRCGSSIPRLHDEWCAACADSHRRGQHPGQDDGAPRGEAGPEQHSGDGDPCESIHGQAIGHIGASLPVAGRMSDVEAMKARLAELPAENGWARP
jgi:hypothetical protein